MNNKIGVFSTLVVFSFLFSCKTKKIETKTIDSSTEVIDSSKSNDDLITYFGQKPPGKTPEIFAPNLISKPNRHEFGCVFSKNADEIFYSIDIDGKAETHYSKLEKGVWSQSEIILKDSTFGYNDPMLSPDEKRLYFISTQPRNLQKKTGDYDIWYVERTDEAWSLPINAGTEINSPRDEYYVSFSETGTMYFSTNKNAPKGQNRNFDIYKSEQINGVFQPANILDENINTPNYEADVFIAPDESYIIFCSIREDGFGRGDLYISFKNDNGSWSPSKNMGKSINSENHELCPFVSADGKYFFYTSNGDIYWVSTAIFKH